jgi:hypothetical protein
MDETHTKLSATEIWQRGDLTPTLKLVLLAIEATGYDTQVSAADLAAMTGQCRRTVIRARKELAQLGLIPARRWSADGQDGYVYAIYDRTLVKIGFTRRSPRQRFTDYLPVAHLRERFGFAHSEPRFAMAEEHQAHADLTAHQHSGEWFERCEAVEAYLAEHFGIKLDAAADLSASAALDKAATEEAIELIGKPLQGSWA